MTKRETERLAKLKLRNQEFKKLSVAQKRVWIAKDVIKQIKLQVIVPEVGNFVHILELEKYTHPFNESDSIQKLFQTKKIETCYCCALGSLMVSCTLFNNRETVADYESHFAELGNIIDGETGILKNGIRKIFTKKQMLMIENAFEVGSGFFGDLEGQGNRSEDILTSYELERCIRFGNEYSNEKNRLIAIMKNIIKNKGIFNP